MLSVDAPNVVVEVVKRSDDDTDALVVRMYEAWGRRGPVTLRVPWSIRRATLTDLLERETDGVATGGAQVTVDLGPFQIATVKLERS